MKFLPIDDSSFIRPSGTIIVGCPSKGNIGQSVAEMVISTLLECEVEVKHIGFCESDSLVGMTSSNYSLNSSSLITISHPAEVYEVPHSNLYILLIRSFPREDIQDQELGVCFSQFIAEFQFERTILLTSSQIDTLEVVPTTVNSDGLFSYLYGKNNLEPYKDLTSGFIETSVVLSSIPYDCSFIQYIDFSTQGRNVLILGQFFTEYQYDLRRKKFALILITKILQFLGVSHITATLNTIKSPKLWQTMENYEASMYSDEI